MKNAYFEMGTNLSTLKPKYTIEEREWIENQYNSYLFSKTNANNYLKIIARGFINKFNKNISTRDLRLYYDMYEYSILHERNKYHHNHSNIYDYSDIIA